MTRRRLLICAALASVVAKRLAVEAQQTGRARIGLVSTGSPRTTPALVAFEQRLRELGHIDGQDIVVEFRNAEGNVDRLPGLVAELVRLPVDIIVTGTAAATRAAKEATSKVPIVIAAIDFDPIALGYVSTLARPGANITGVFFRQSELAVKRLELFKELLPAPRRLAVLYDSLAADQVNAVEAASHSIGVKLALVNLGNPPYELESAFGAAKRSRANALFVLTSPVIFRERTQLAQLALKHRLPTSFAHREHAEAGGLMTFGANMPDMYRLVADRVDKILKGAKPADLPVEQPTKFELVINLNTARALELTIPRSLLLRADQVID
jgi:putative tryptophan/tyrosine transport system substrate-binding protein